MLTSEDTYQEVVYENLDDLCDKKNLAEIIIQLIDVLNTSTLINKKEIKIGEKTLFGYDEKKRYVIYISKNKECNKKWKFANIEIVC